MNLQQGNWSGPQLIGVTQEGLEFSVRQVLANGEGGGGSVLPVFKLGAVTRVGFIARRQSRWVDR